MFAKQKFILGIIAFGILLFVPVFTRAATEVTGNIGSNETWTTTGSPYIIATSTTVTLSSGVTLTIEPGVIVKFKSSAELSPGQGKLAANGTSASPIIFTSYKDDTAAGDTNGDGSASSPAQGDWSRIVLGNTTDSITYAEIRYGSRCVNAHSAAPVIQNNTFQYCGTAFDGNSLNVGTVNFRNNTLRDNGRGFQLFTAADLVISNNNIFDNTVYGADNQIPSTVVSALDNWWGNAGGPCLPANQPGCTGYGDKITDGFTVTTYSSAVITFTPASSGVFVPPSGSSGQQISAATIPPKILKFEADKESVKEGEDGATLSWETQNVEYVTLISPPVNLPLSGSLLVHPQQTTTYTLIALGPGGEVKKDLTITVLPRDPVIIVPGILGSWRDINDEAEPSLDPILHSYDGLWEGLKSVGYKEKQTLFAFPYDWRRDNRETAVKFGQKIDKVLEICSCSKVDIIAHSMGGLVARYYVQSINDKAIDQLIFLGTPHLGAPKAYLAWEAGEMGKGRDDNLFEAIFKLEALGKGYLNVSKYIQEKIQSIKQLLPVFDYLSDYATGTKYPYSRCREGLFFCNDFIEALSKVEPKDYQEIRSYNIISREFDRTFLGFSLGKGEGEKWKNGKPFNYPSEEGITFGNGDETVPVHSAEWGVGDIKYVIAQHRLLPYYSQSEVSKILINQEIKKFGKTPPKRWLLIGIKSPVDITVTTPSGKVYGAGAGDDGWAFYSGTEDPEFITIPDPEDGDFAITVTGTGEGGKFGLEATLIADEHEDGISYEGEIAPGQQLKFTLTNSSSEAADKILQMKVLDLVPPETSVLLEGEKVGEGYAPGLLAVLQASDDTGGLIETQFSIDDGNSWNGYEGNLKFDNIGEYRILYKSTDKSGNSEQVKVARFAVVAKPAPSIIAGEGDEPQSSAGNIGLDSGRKSLGDTTGQVKGETETGEASKRNNIFFFVAFGILILSLLTFIKSMYGKKNQ